MRTRIRGLAGGISLLALVFSSMAASCRSTRSHAVGPTMSPIRSDAIAPALRDEWEAVARAMEQDPGGASVFIAADELLAKRPPALLRLAVLHVKAENAYVAGDDRTARHLAQNALTDRELSTLSGREAAQIRSQLTALDALALARGGSPAGDALRAIDTARREQALADVEAWAAKAVVFDRSGDIEQALLAFMRWRELVVEGSADAIYAEDRVHVLMGRLDVETLRRLAPRAGTPRTTACLHARTSGVVEPDMPAWIRRCVGAPMRVGLLLPRSGPLAALADVHLAAASVAVTVLREKSGRALELVWRDSGSTPERTRAGLEALLATGAEVIVGPVGAANVSAVSALAHGRPVVLPGESMASLPGVAASLDDRVGALIRTREAQLAKRVLVLAPNNAYGRRARQAAQNAGRAAGIPLEIVDYAPETTSFASILAPIVPKLHAGAALLVPDRLTRLELMLRQLAREGLGSSTRAGATRVVVLTTAEDATPDILRSAVLEGTIAAPTKLPASRADRAFVEAFMRVEGRPPSDHALLVFAAMERAVLGAKAGLVGEPVLAEVKDGGFVARPITSVGPSG